MVANMQAINAAMLDFYEQVTVYKHDLACNLQLVFETYNAIFLKQF